MNYEPPQFDENGNITLYGTFYPTTSMKHHKKLREALFSAILEGDTNTVKKLIEADVDVQNEGTYYSKPNEPRRAPMHLSPLEATVRICPEDSAPAIVDKLLEAKAKLTYYERNNSDATIVGGYTFTSDTLLTLAIKEGKPKLTEHILTKLHMDPNKGTLDGELPLSLAVTNNDPNIRDLLITTLLSAGANVNQVGCYMQTPLHIAARHNIPILKKFVEAGGELTRDNGNGTPMAIAAQLHYKDPWIKRMVKETLEQAEQADIDI